MKFFLTLLLLLSTWLGGMAEEIVDGFKISIRSNGDAYITSYEGNDIILNIPEFITTADGVSHKVTSIRALMDYSKKQTQEVFIPSSVQSIGYSEWLFDLCTNTKLRTVVFSTANFKIESKKPFRFSEDPTQKSFDFDNIIILGNCSYTIENLIQFRNNDYKSHFIKPGVIKISYLNDPNDLTVQMYLFRHSDATPWTFDQARFNDLISALRKAGKLANIKTIDLSGMSTTAAPIKFDGVETNFAYIEDLSEYTAPTSDLSAPIFYSRTDTKGWNSVCLPFPIRESDFPEGTKIYTMTGGNAEKILLTRIGQDETLNAGTPCFIKSEASSWDLNINATIPAQVAPASVTQEGNSWVLHGSFSEILLGIGKYKLNGEGTEFVQTKASSHAWPFRCYIAEKNPSAGAPARLSVGVDEEASITLVPNDAEPQTVKLIDLMGRPRQGNAPGLYIRSKH